jgi:hypothetical protein
LQARSALYDLDNIRLDDLGASKTLYVQQTRAEPVVESTASHIGAQRVLLGAL